MFDKSQLYKKLIGFGLWSLLALGIGVAGAMIIAGQIRNIALALEKKQASEIALRNRGETIRSLRQDISRIGNSESLIVGAIPTADNMPQVLSAINGVASSASIRSDMRRDVPTPFQTMGTSTVLMLTFQITANGNISTLLPFLRGLESLPYLVEIDSVGMVAPQGWQANSSITLPGKLYLIQTI